MIRTISVVSFLCGIRHCQQSYQVRNGKIDQTAVVIIVSDLIRNRNGASNNSTRKVGNFEKAPAGTTEGS